MFVVYLFYDKQKVNFNKIFYAFYDDNNYCILVTIKIVKTLHVNILR